MPVIAKADTMTADETLEFRKDVSDQLEKENIQLYRWILPTGVVDEKLR